MPPCPISGMVLRRLPYVRHVRAAGCTVAVFRAVRHVMPGSEETAPDGSPVHAPRAVLRPPYLASSVANRVATDTSSDPDDIIMLVILSPLSSRVDCLALISLGSTYTMSFWRRL